MASSRLHIFRSVIAAPVLCLALLGGISFENRQHVPPPDVAGYHAAMKQTIENDIPYFIGPNNKWIGKDVPIPIASQKLLRLNAFVSRLYVDNDPSDSSHGRHQANLLLEQCSDSSDMDGHWPKVCYPARGQKLEFEEKRKWTIGGMEIPLNEFHFVENANGRTNRWCVYNFLIVPQRGIKRDMADVRKAAADYRLRFFGAAQVQVLMDGDLPQTERESIFADLITPITPVIKAITSGGQQ